MEEPQIIPPGSRRRRASWIQAYVAFIRSPHENRVLKLMPLVLMGIVPISVLDDFVLPVFGIIDDIPTAAILGATILLTYFRVKRYK